MRYNAGYEKGKEQALNGPVLWVITLYDLDSTNGRATVHFQCTPLNSYTRIVDSSERLQLIEALHLTSNSNPEGHRWESMTLDGHQAFREVLIKGGHKQKVPSQKKH